MCLQRIRTHKSVSIRARPDLYRSCPRSLRSWCSRDIEICYRAAFLLAEPDICRKSGGVVECSLPACAGVGDYAGGGIYGRDGGGPAFGGGVVVAVSGANLDCPGWDTSENCSRIVGKLAVEVGVAIADYAAILAETDFARLPEIGVHCFHTW